MIDSPWYAEISAGSIIRIVETKSRRAYWFDYLDDDTKAGAWQLPRFDINRRRFIKVR